MTDDLETALLDAHAKGHLPELVRLYAAAADRAAPSDTDRACFFLTHAWVFALEAGDTRADALKRRLIDYGREVAT